MYSDLIARVRIEALYRHLVARAHYDEPARVEALEYECSFLNGIARGLENGDGANLDIAVHAARCYARRVREAAEANAGNPRGKFYLGVWQDVQDTIAAV